MYEKNEVDIFFNTPIEGWSNDPCEICPHKAENEDLKKECEIWKNQVLTLDDEAITVQITQQQFEDYNQLKAENEELKMKNSILEDEYKILEDNLDSRTRDFEDVIEGYKQTLTEIKEICRFNFTMTTTNLLAKTILQKISECKAEDEN